MGMSLSSIETDWYDTIQQSYTQVCPNVAGVQVISNTVINLVLPNSCHFEVIFDNESVPDQNCVMNTIINTVQNFVENNEALAESAFSLSASDANIAINGDEYLSQYITQKCGDWSSTQLVINSIWNENGGCPKLIEFSNSMNANVYCAMGAFTSDMQAFAATNQATAKTIGLLSGLMAGIMALIAIVAFVMLSPSLFRRSRSRSATRLIAFRKKK